MVLTEAPAVGSSLAGGSEKPTAIEYLEGQTVKITLRDNTALQGSLKHIGWMDADSEAISYLCLKIDPESTYVLQAQGISTKSGIIFVPWDFIAYLVLP